MEKKLYYINGSEYFWMSDEEMDTFEKYLAITGLDCDIDEIEVTDFAEALRNA